jgi:aspartate/methionine/tyrosine aminotransferase
MGAGFIPEACEHTISLFSLSKAYGFASQQTGYMVVPEHLYPAILKIEDTNSSACHHASRPTNQ